jgi:hypothetical protein
VVRPASPRADRLGIVIAIYIWARRTWRTPWKWLVGYFVGVLVFTFLMYFFEPQPNPVTVLMAATVAVTFWATRAWRAR